MSLPSTDFRRIPGHIRSQTTLTRAENDKENKRTTKQRLHYQAKHRLHYHAKHWERSGHLNNNVSDS